MNISILSAYNDKPIAFNRHFVTIGCGISGALMLSQAVYWSSRTKDVDSWFYKTQAEWEQETGLTRREQESARKRLAELGVLEEKKQGVPARLFYRVDFARIHELLIVSVDIKEDEKRVTNKNGGKRHTRMAESANLLTETTTDIVDNNKNSEKAKQVIDYLNIKAGTAYRHAQSHLRLITARINDGATVDEMKRVIDQKCEDWLSDNRMKTYLRPSTLFNATNYENYAGSISAEQSNSEPTEFMIGL